MKTLVNACKMMLVMTVITGVFYPLFITLFAQVLFPSKANGSLIRENGVIRGSRLIGQQFDSTAYFWSRPSATGYDPMPSGATQFALTSRLLSVRVQWQEERFMQANGFQDPEKIPSEMIFASGSGLDPHISPLSALMQVNRVVSARQWNHEKWLQTIHLVDSLTEGPQFLFFGERRINVLLLNLGLDKIDDTQGKRQAGSR